MPLGHPAARSSRISKRPQQLLRRSASSPFTDFTQRKPIQRSKSKVDVADNDDGFFGDRLDDIGIVKSLASDLSLRDVAQSIQYVHSHMFTAIPDDGGFNSTRIAEILNFRKSLPPTVTLPHLHALTQSPTKTEREIAELTRAGIVRRLVTPGRGTGGSSIGESLILSKDVESLLRQAEELSQELADKFSVCLRTKPMALKIPPSTFSSAEITALMRAGFLTSSVQGLNSTNVFAGPDSGPPGNLTSISTIAKAASGSMAAIGGEGAIYGAGGRGGIRRSSSQLERSSEQQSSEPFGEGVELRLSLPGTGALLKLLSAARSHLVSLAIKSKFREIPIYLLREKWDGGISADDPAAKAKKYRGEFTGILPSRTRRWKQFYGLSFDWTLAECLGAGLVEVFETGSVGQAVRIP
ncbi:hypothetical protein HO133_008794 [Letharia lupina]|uniref:Serine-threonine protein kinase 19 n=1 Tax=Letharia lupina TaxID=560253 RepID=A0A8H6CPR8_9LECA|nr:uncharacterized protein HO133_008794 [Letharia lupina]KAF6227350.1 hypothetical protein HO133_008794 [Letharia lupina]